MKTPPSNAAPAIQEIVLGIDPGLATTGWGVVGRIGREMVLQSFGAILSPARQALPERLCWIHHELGRIIEQFRPTVIAIEQLYFAKFAVSIAATAQARGVILLGAAIKNIPVVEYNPRAVKIALTGFGSANKIQMQTMLQRHFRLRELPTPDDAADAVAIALCHGQTHHGLRVPVSKRSRAEFEAEMAARAGVTL